MSELCKILIVDDEILVRQGIRHHLNWEQHGFRIVGEASNGKEALAMIEPLSPDIIITDIVMPVMDGEEFVRVLKTHYPNIEVIVLSSYGEFNYVRSTFQSGVADYILKPKLETSELLQVLQTTARKVPGLNYSAHSRGGELSLEQLLERLLSGYPPEDQEQESQLLKLFPHRSFVLAGADLSGVSGDPHSYMSGLASSLKSCVAECSFPAIAKVIPSESKQLLMLINVASQDEGQVFQMVRDFAAEKSNSMPMLVWAVSTGFEDLLKLEAVYREEWLSLLAYRFYFPGHTYLRASELPAVLEVPEFDMKQLLAELRKGQFHEGFHRLRAYVSKAASNYRVPPFQFKSFLGNAIFNMTVVLTGSSERMKELDQVKYDYFRAIDESRSVSEAIIWMERFLEMAEQLAEAQAPLPGDDNMRRLLQYIDEHYSEPLSLGTLSKHFHFNPSYLSSYFSTHNAEGFSEYLNKIRIRRASELLCSSTLTISEISAQVGYGDHSYFTKVFKKQTGSSPSQYRRDQYGQRAGQ